MASVVQRTDKKSLWVQYMHQRIRQNKNMVIFIFGQVGSGKSYSAVEICRQADPYFTEDQIVFSPNELMELMNSGKLRKGSAIVYEECGVSLDATKWQSTTNQMMRYLLETFRHRNFILIFTSPFMNFMAKKSRMLIQAAFETKGIDFENNCCKIKPMQLQYNARNDKTYWKYLRVNIKGKYRPIQEWRIPKLPEELLKQYETKKKAFTDKLYDQIKKNLEGLNESKEKPYWSCSDCGNEWQPRKRKPTFCSACRKTNVTKLEE